MSLARRRLDNSREVTNVLDHTVIVKRYRRRSRNRRGRLAGRAPSERERCGPEGGSPQRRRAGRARQGGTGRSAALEPRRATSPPRAAPRPDQAARAPGKDARAGARADPLRAHARLAVHVLSRSGADHGQRPRGDAALGASGAVLRRRAPVELRRVRLARAAAGVRRQRLRRDAARAVGVGRQAPGGEHADRRAQQRLRRPRTRSRSCSTPSPQYRTAMARFRRDEEPRRSGTPISTSRRRSQRTRLAVQTEDGQANREDARQGAHQGQHGGVLQALPRGRRRGADRRPNRR